MEVVIKKLTPGLIEDYIDFFDNRAFTDNMEWSGCYCVFYHWNDGYEKSLRAPGIDVHDHNRRLASDFIRDGILQGYLAYADGIVVGWCNANDKNSFETLGPDKRPDLWDGDTDKKIKSITCYTIAPDMRRKGIATKLLEQVCMDAKEDGYDFVEAYPGKSVKNEQRNYHGHYHLYEKSGFSLFKELEREYIMQKSLKK